MSQRLPVEALKRTIVALDPGTLYTGVALGKAGELIRAYTYTRVEVSEASAPFLMRQTLVPSIVTAAGGYSEIAAVVLEDYAMGAAHMNLRVPELCGALIYHFRYEKNIPVFFMPVSTVRKLVAGKGNATKSEIKQAVLPRLPVSLEIHGEQASALPKVLKKLQFHATDAAAIYLSFHEYYLKGDLSESFIRRSLM
jgi:Holliday junction resolvasome RuvABC endonuclease subunit